MIFHTVPDDVLAIMFDRLAGNSVEIKCLVPGLHPTCWVPARCVEPDNIASYPRMKVPGHPVMQMHRVAYQYMFGPIGDLVVDHMCHTPACWNPWHLDAVTRAVNSSRRLADNQWAHQCRVLGDRMITPVTVVPCADR